MTINSHNIKKALILFKPDAIAMRQFSKGLRIVTKELATRHINHRFIKPQIMRVTPALVNSIY